MKPKLVIFDLDGTVLDTLEDLLDALNHSLGENDYAPHTLSEMRTFVGSGLYMMALRALPLYTRKETVDKVFDGFKSYYAAHLNIKTRPFPGICDMLGRLKAQGIRTGIVSNKFEAGAKALTDAHFGELVDMTVGEREGMGKKPDPAGTKLIMQKIGAFESETLYVGDSDVDVKTAHNAGLKCICVSWGSRSVKQLTDAGADKIVYTVNELEAAFCID